ncbi:MAG: glycosyltransferase family 39 protein [Gemmatimonadaceae bacterium]|nr:glycosyltransferase family 39 protein [Gemmatimonadaceae bacterium]
MPIVPPESASATAKRSVAEQLNQRIGWALPALAALAFAIFRLPELTRSSLWYDELFSMGVAELPLADALRRIVADHTNPPLFYLLLKGWMAIGGDSDHWVRLLPCLFSMLLGAALVWLAREVRTGTRAGLLAVALAAASPLSVDLATEVRGYSLLSLLACLSLAAVLHDRARRTRETFALLTLINIALVHTHYFGWLTVGAELVTAMLVWPRDDARRVGRSTLFTAIAFLPWASAVLYHATTEVAPLRNVAWIAAPTVMDPLWLFRDLTGRSGVAVADLGWIAFASVALIALAVTAVRRRGMPPAALQEASKPPVAGTLPLLAAAGFVAPVAVFAVSSGGAQSLWVQRYLLGAAAPVALLTGIAIAALPPRRLSVAAIAGFLWVGVACAALPQRAPTKFDWRRFVTRLERASVGGPRDVFALEAFTGAPLVRYATPGMRVAVVRSLYQLPSGEFWLVYRRDSFATGTATDRLRAMGYRVVTALSAETAGQRIAAVRIVR